MSDAVNSVIQIGRYQLENLTREGVRFLFIDLRTDAERAAGPPETLLAKSMPMTFEQLQENLKLNQIPLDAAILLLDNAGEAAPQAAANLEAQGYKNVYVVRGGAASL